MKFGEIRKRQTATDLAARQNVRKGAEESPQTPLPAETEDHSGGCNTSDSPVISLASSSIPHTLEYVKFESPLAARLMEITYKLPSREGLRVSPAASFGGHTHPAKEDAGTRAQIRLRRPAHGPRTLYRLGESPMHADARSYFSRMYCTGWVVKSQASRGSSTVNRGEHLPGLSDTMLKCTPETGQFSGCF